MKDIPLADYITTGMPPGYTIQRNQGTRYGHDEFDIIHAQGCVGTQSTHAAARLYAWDRWSEHLRNRMREQGKAIPRDPPHDGQGYVIDGPAGLIRVQSLMEARVRSVMLASLEGV